MNHYFIAFVKGSRVKLERVAKFDAKPQITAEFIEPNEGTWVTCYCRAVYWQSGDVVDSSDFGYGDFCHEIKRLGYDDGIPF